MTKTFVIQKWALKSAQTQTPNLLFDNRNTSRTLKQYQLTIVWAPENSRPTHTY
ncbi:hypothetical protein AG1IA_01682 [Rhizoctonia solani AG-1 IA]|uniref:Uncharacterized protein n=1 Tax=Thanatephorus cucumeris (strain AG1-IA) TaxID=983506 RepID=L8X252_THACA|nr:hypothetical protein AG1IA_01682 [Rhizoctonia solani AG-1 IA]